MYGPAPPLIVIAGTPEAVAPHGCAPTANTTDVIGPDRIFAFTDAVVAHP